MFLETLAASILGKEVIRADKGQIRAGQNFSLVSFFN